MSSSCNDFLGVLGLGVDKSLFSLSAVKSLRMEVATASEIQNPENSFETWEKYGKRLGKN